MVVTVNGERHELPTGSTVASVVQRLSTASDGRGVAVAVGGEVVPRTQWSQTELPEGAWIEVLGAVQGG